MDVPRSWSYLIEGPAERVHCAGAVNIVDQSQELAVVYSMDSANTARRGVEGTVLMNDEQRCMEQGRVQYTRV